MLNAAAGAVLAVAVAFLLSVWRKWKLLATIAGLGFFVLGGVVFAG